MTHLIEFTVELSADLEVSPTRRLERLSIRKGSRLRADLQPSVKETPQGPIEVADLVFEDGTVTRAVSYGWFRFVDE